MKKEDKLYNLLVTRMQEMAIVPPQNVGPFTTLYKRLTSELKWYPVRSVTVISFLISLIFFALLGSRLIKLASLLQYGF